MSVLIDKSTRLLVQGLTGREGTFHAKQAAAYGTVVVGGVTPGKGGTTHEGWPIFNTVAEAVAATGANASVIFVQAPVRRRRDHGGRRRRPRRRRVHQRGHSDAGDDAGPDVPQRTRRRGSSGRTARASSRRAVRRPASFPATSAGRDRVGIVSRSGTLTYEAIHQLTLRNLGQTTCIGIGGDPLIGTSFIDALRLFDGDADTEAVVHDRRDRGHGGGGGRRLHQPRVHRSRSSASSRGRPRRRGAGWGMRARSSRAARAPPPRRWRR